VTPSPIRRRGREGCGAWLAALIALGCGGGPVEAASTLPREAPRPPRAGPRDAGDGAEDESADAVAAALERVSALRELAPRGPVRSRTLSRAQIAERVREHIAREVPDAVVQGSTALLVGLGVVPQDFDYVGAFMAFMSSELAGLYEPHDATMYLAEDLGRAEREATLMHELVHALQDQHYDLGRALRYEPGEGDRQAALHALGEGDATSLMLDALLAGRGATALEMPESLLRVQVLGALEASPGVASVPSIIRRSAVAPYLDGMAFVHALRRQGGWAAVDAVWRDPPESTEQVLHLDKLAQREAPEAIAVPAAPDASWVLVFSDVLGEQALRLVLEEWVPARTATAAAAGWGGDRVAVYRSGEEWLVLLHVRWDDEGSARGGEEALARGVLGEDSASREAAQAAIRRGAVCRDRPDRGVIASRRMDRDVAVLAGPFRHGVTESPGRGSCVTARALLDRMLRGRAG
jgi:hypothetical protein